MHVPVVCLLGLGCHSFSHGGLCLAVAALHAEPHQCASHDAMHYTPWRGLQPVHETARPLSPFPSVEKPFLKPVVLVGPHTGERPALLRRLAEEFPDVFGLPRAHTTFAAGDERREHAAADGAGVVGRYPHNCVGRISSGVGVSKPGLWPRHFRCRTLHQSRHSAATYLHCLFSPPTGDELGFRTPRSAGSGGSGSSGSEGVAAKDEQEAPSLAPALVVLSPAEFDSFVADGRFLEWHTDLFKHPLATYHTGHTPEDVRAVIKEGTRSWAWNRSDTCLCSGWTETPRSATCMVETPSALMGSVALPTVFQGPKPLSKASVVLFVCHSTLHPSTDTPGFSLAFTLQASCPSWSWRPRAPRPSRRAAWTA
jgi:hypothetical protein